MIPAQPRRPVAVGLLSAARGKGGFKVGNRGRRRAMPTPARADRTSARGRTSGRGHGTP